MRTWSRWIYLGVILSGLLFAPRAFSQSERRTIYDTREHILEGARKEGQVAVFPGFEESTTPHLINAFKKKYPFINATWLKASSAGGFEKQLSDMKAGTAVVDAFRPAPNLWREYFNNNLYRRYDLKAMARAGHLNIPPEMIDDSGVIVWSGTNMGVMVYNTKLVAPENTPTGWDSCLDPKWKGKFGVDTKPNVLAFLASRWGEQKLLDYARKLKQNDPIWIRGSTRGLARLAQGEFAFICGAYLHATERALMKDRSLPIKMAIPDPLGIAFHEPEAVYAGAKNPHAALLWIDYLASPEGQALLDSIDPGRASFLIEGTLANRLAKGANTSICGTGCRDREDKLEERIAVDTWGLPKVGE